MSAIFLATLAALIHCSCAITCYVCNSKSVQACDDPFIRNKTYVHTCPSNACLKAKARAKGK